MKELLVVLETFKAYFKNSFDFTLLSSQHCPYLVLTYIKVISDSGPEITDHHFFAKSPSPELPSSLPVVDLYSLANSLTAHYLHQLSDPNDETISDQAIQNKDGFVYRIWITDEDFLVVTIICDPEDQLFLYHSLLNQLGILGSSVQP